MVDFVSAFATASNALKLVNDLWTVNKAFDEADLKLTIANLKGALAELKVALAEAKDEIARLQEDNTHLEDLLSQLGDTVEVGGFKYFKNKEGQPTGHPICPVCAQKDGLLFRTVDTRVSGLPQQCPNCKMLYHNALTFED